MKNIVMGIVAHVDAGKTTLCEAMLYTCGATDRLGRVDNRDAYLDTHALERERGITIFSKQALLDTGNTHITLIDTPGHADFSCETERALSVQDYAILVISATDGVQAHTKTLWQLLSSRRIPTFIFVNKTDICERSRQELADELRTTLSPHCVDFTRDGTPDFFEECASRSERLMAEYFDTDSLSAESICEAIRRRDICPCYFGSALKLRGIRELLSALDKYTEQTEYHDTLFGARVYKIMRDKAGRRLTFAKITGGTLKPKDTVTVGRGSSAVSEKVEELRAFSADRSKPLKEAAPGTVCAILGLTATKAGMGLGTECDDSTALLPPLNYRLLLPQDVSPYETFLKLSDLAEEDPALSLAWDSEHSQIRVSLMGEIQLEVLRRLVKERLNIDISFDEGQILYKETIAERVRGSGHFEPLCHYAEVHLELEPLPEGSGVIAAAECSTDTLATNWQRLIMTHIEERTHRGRLLGAPLTDVKITVIGGRAHQKHTEGGDFRQATYRAIRQALMKSHSVILEPTFDFRIELPAENLGRALNDITNMYGTVKDSGTDGTTAYLEGSCPVSTIRSYAMTLRAYTKGFGRISLTPGAYAPCHNSEEVIAERGYDPELDERNPAGSVFCKGGSGYAVPWWEADGKMHAMPRDNSVNETDGESDIPLRARAVTYRGTPDEDKELMRIFEATYGKVKRRHAPEKTVIEAEPKTGKRPPKIKPRGDEYILIDGYNVIFAWEHLRKFAEGDFSLARDTLIRQMCNYSAFRRCRVIIVFDAYRVKDGKGSVQKCGNTTVVYTKERQSADAYIEKATYDMAKEHYVRVVTSDMAEQYIILGNGALRVSPQEFLDEVNDIIQQIQDKISE